MSDLRCLSCNQKIVNDESVARFNCPSCGKYEIIRCGHCRSIAATYTCAACSFTGPN